MTKELSPELVEAIKTEVLGFHRRAGTGSDSHDLEHAVQNIIDEALPLLEAEVRKDEREKVLREQLTYTMNLSVDGQTLTPITSLWRAMVVQYAFHQYNLDLTHQDQDGEQ